MFDAKFMRMSLALGGALFLASGCSGVTETPTPTGATPTPTAAAPDALYFDETYFTVDCSTTAWDIFGTVDGWTDVDSGIFGIYDNPDFYSEGQTMWYEEHLMAALSYDDPSYYEELSLALDIVATIGEQIDGETSIFQCANESFLTYSFCATDFHYGGAEQCVFFGKDPDYWEAEVGARIYE